MFDENAFSVEAFSTEAWLFDVLIEHEPQTYHGGPGPLLLPAGADEQDFQDLAVIFQTFRSACNG